MLSGHVAAYFHGLAAPVRAEQVRPSVSVYIDNAHAMGTCGRYDHLLPSLSVTRVEVHADGASKTEMATAEAARDQVGPAVAREIARGLQPDVLRTFRVDDDVLEGQG